MIEEVKIHKGYAEFETFGKEKGIKQIFGKYQYIFSSKKGEISCIELKDYFMDGKDLWEIYCIRGDLFEDIERFDTFLEAKKRCQELLK